eukprot:CAMPEP_0170795532 /NCGR_PEP_ID=MMETSP0733-20121128/24191_1 /TAXON_ID=186038 /ORGANISM="Fragilariopsis kerguelensis, Strain L26-C5" /LENGTH=151 /DNA_ID=CAMNT_0011145461 /DNA_START=154 /DNA_END=606 /DNA_ORIENTATION=+
MSSTKNNNTNNSNDEKNNGNENIVLVDAADVIEVKGEGLEDVDLDDADTPTKAATEEEESSEEIVKKEEQEITEHDLDDDDTPTKAAEEEESSEELLKKEEIQEPEEQEAKGPVHYFPWWKGGGVIPTCGKDLGTHTKSLEDRANVLELWW